MRRMHQNVSGLGQFNAVAAISCLVSVNELILLYAENITVMTSSIPEGRK